MKILHILHRSLPGTHGYAIRSKNIVEYQKTMGLDPIVITSPFQSGSENADRNPEYINNIPYYRTNLSGKIGSTQVRTSSLWLSALRLPLIFLFAKYVLDVARKTKPSIIHAHSPFYCGLIASWVSKSIGISSIYEIRGVWEGSSASVKNSKIYLPQKVMGFLENRAIQSADAIVVISKHLKEELSYRGINNNTYIVPNGVDTTKFTHKEKSRKLLKELHLEEKIVLGYIGTFSAEYEGIEYLIKALPLIINKHPQVVLLLVGDGRMKEMLVKLSKKIGVCESIVFTGKIPHDRISEYYSVIDISIFPRKRTRETELVTPIKPLEAMAIGNPVIGSNVGGMKELISDGVTGILFEAENVNDLAEKCLYLIEAQEKRDILRRQAKEWVLRNRDWLKVVQQYKRIYDNLYQDLPNNL